jgi:limonene 1,2-monooxygenase
MSDRLRFGIFMAPFHPAGENPTLALERDLDLIAHLDKLGYDEAWIGEHHSAGSEIIASPEIFIATAAERTRHIKLGTGVISVAYHNPYMVAERAVLLDHLTRGRFMLGWARVRCPPMRSCSASTPPRRDRCSKKAST